jgi:hypothetical protein
MKKSTSGTKSTKINEVRVLAATPYSKTNQNYRKQIIYRIKKKPLIEHTRGTQFF